MTQTVLLVTITIGEKYIQQYNTLFRKSQELYANRHGYDFKVITDFLEIDKSNRHPSTISFQKILVCSQEWSKEYDVIVFIDADILINSNAPPLPLSTLDKNIQIVNEFSQPTFHERISIQIRAGWERTPEEYYKLASPIFQLETDYMLNTGLMITQPKIHSEFLQTIYNKYIKESIGHRRGFHFEQSAIGYELQKENRFTLLDNKWNAIWALNSMSKKYGVSLQEFVDSNYFIHFAGGVDLYKIPLITY